MPTLPNMSIVTPTLGGDSGTWDDKINDAFGLVDAHDHSSGKGVKVTPSGLNINADLAFAGNGATGLGKVLFNAVTALASGSKALFVSSADNELYWRTNAGTNVKLTSGTSINTTLVGGIVGDYSSVGAEVAFDDANDRYTFKMQGSPKPWARLASGPVRIFEFNTVETVYVGLNAPTALAAAYDITLPLAAPGSTSFVLMDSSGVLTVTNTVPNAITFSTSISTPTIAGTPNFTGAVTMASTLVALGTVKGSDLKHSDNRFLQVSAATAVASSTGPTINSSCGSWAVGTTTGRLAFPINLNANDRITRWSIFCNKASGSGTITGQLYSMTTAGVEAAEGTSATNSAASPGDVELLKSSLAIDITSTKQYYLVFTGGGVTGDTVRGVEVAYTRP